jgi:hypothetical protein
VVGIFKKQSKTKKMKILIACEESQTVCKAFRKLGFDAYSCDLQECSGNENEYHILGDCIKEAYSGKYDLMIAHPPCTFISKAGARWMYKKAGTLCQKRYEQGIKAKEFFLMLLNAPIQKICIENPTPLKILDIPKHTQSIQPFEFGHPYSKRTLLWLKGLPMLKPTNILREYKPYLPSNTGGKKRGQKYQFKSITQKESSKTFEGIAEAMAKQWSFETPYIEPQYKLF